MSPETVVKIAGLHKEFDYRAVLKDINLDIHAGSIVGLLGANGAGKSTLLRHMVGLYLPNKGGCTTLGCDAAKLGPRELARIGYTHQEGGLIEWMNVEQLVRYVAVHYPSWNAELEREYRAEFKIDGDALVGDLSPGQRQILAILLAIGAEPDLLLLDEPAAALDPLARQRFLDLLLRIIQDPRRTVLISSHILSDVEKVIDHVIILDDGEVCCDTPLDELQQRFQKLRLTSVRGELPDPLPFPGVVTCRRSRGEAVAVVRARPEHEWEHMAREAGSAVDVLPLSLEELYGLVLSSRGVESAS